MTPNSAVSLTSATTPRQKNVCFEEDEEDDRIINPLCLEERSTGSSRGIITDPEEVAEAMSSSEFFTCEVGKGTIPKLASYFNIAIFEHTRNDSPLLKRGDDQHFVGVVLSGALSVRNAQGSPLYSLASGDTIGESLVAISRQGTQQNDVFVRKPGRMLCSTIELLERLQIDDPLVHRQLMDAFISKSMARTISEANYQPVTANKSKGPYVALIAHDAKKEALLAFCKEHRDVLARCQLTGTATTCSMLLEIGLKSAFKVPSGPLGGDQSIGALIAHDLVDAVIFIKDSLSIQCHYADIEALCHLCDVRNVPHGTNPITGEAIVHHLQELHDLREGIVRVNRDDPAIQQLHGLTKPKPHESIMLRPTSLGSTPSFDRSLEEEDRESGYASTASAGGCSSYSASPAATPPCSRSGSPSPPPRAAAAPRHEGHELKIAIAGSCRSTPQRVVERERSWARRGTEARGGGVCARSGQITAAPAVPLERQRALEGPEAKPHSPALPPLPMQRGRSDEGPILKPRSPFQLPVPVQRGRSDPQCHFLSERHNDSTTAKQLRPRSRLLEHARECDDVEGLAAELSGRELFSTLSSDELELLAEMLRIVEVARGETLFCEGEPADAALIVLSGRVELLVADRVQQKLKAGDVYGQANVILDQPASTWEVSAEAARPSKIALLPRAELARLSARDPHAYTRLNLWLGVMVLRERAQDAREMGRKYIILTCDNTPPALQALVEFVSSHHAFFSQHQRELIGPIDVLESLHEKTGLSFVHSVQAPLLGGAMELGDLVCRTRVRAAVVFRDHRCNDKCAFEALLRLTDLYAVPSATNPATADLLVKYLGDSRCKI